MCDAGMLWAVAAMYSVCGFIVGVAALGIVNARNGR